MKIFLLKDQRGVAMVLELALVAVVLAAVGVVGYRVLKPVSPVAQTSSKTASADTTPNGKVGSAEKSLTAEAADESHDNAQESTNVGSVDSAEADTTNVGGAYDESKF